MLELLETEAAVEIEMIVLSYLMVHFSNSSFLFPKNLNIYLYSVF